MRLLVDISGHGLGHFMQAVPVALGVNAIDPGVTFVIRTSVDALRVEPTLASLGSVEFAAPTAEPFHPVMSDAFTIDADATAARCAATFARRAALVRAEMDWLEDRGIDAVASDICPVSLDAAQRAGKPAIALCSINWAEVLAFDPALARSCAGAIAYLRGVYANCDLTVRLRPFIDGLPGRRRVETDPVARIGANRRAEILSRAGLAVDLPLVMISSGGMANFPFAIALPARDDVAWLLPEGMDATHATQIAAARVADIGFIDRVASSHVLVAKPGYGLVVEAIANGVKLALIERTNFVDVPSLVAFAHQQGSAIDLALADFASGAWVEKAAALARDGRTPQRPAFKGIEQAAREILQELGRGRGAQASGESVRDKGSPS